MFNVSLSSEGLVFWQGRGWIWLKGLAYQMDSKARGTLSRRRSLLFAYIIVYCASTSPVGEEPWLEGDCDWLYQIGKGAGIHWPDLVDLAVSTWLSPSLSPSPYTHLAFGSMVSWFLGSKYSFIDPHLGLQVMFLLLDNSNIGHTKLACSAQISLVQLSLTLGRIWNPLMIGFIWHVSSLALSLALFGFVLSQTEAQFLS